MILSDDDGARVPVPAFGQYLKRRRIEADLTQEALAERARVSARLISDLERGRIGRPRRSTAEQLADGLALSGPERTAFIIRARAASTASDPAPSPLPRPANSFVGREPDIAALATLLCQPGLRLITLTGPGGVGKTRLSLEAAARVVDAYDDGARFVDLTPVRDPALVLPTIANALGLETNSARALPERLSGWIGHKRLLLLLDNVEHVVDAAPEVAALLAACPRLTVLATSREPLRICAEHDYAVDPLPLPDAGRLPPLGELRRIPAVDLFAHRAGSTSRTFALTSGNARAIAGIVNRLDGLPLAIELAAARIKVVPPDTLLARLERRLPLLTGGARDLPYRQQAMRATIDWSYNLLTPAEQALLRQISVFAGGFTEDAAATVSACVAAEGCDTFPVLAALVEKSLVRLEGGDGAEARYSMLQVIREYGQERLERAGEGGAARHRHALWCLALAERSGPLLRGRDQASWLTRFDIDHDNFRAALRWTRDRQDAVLAARLAIALRRFWNLRGHTAEGRRWLEQVLEIGHDLPPAIRAGVLTAVGTVAYHQGDYARTSALDEALAIYRDLDDTVGVASSLANLGMVAQAQGDSRRATTLIEESLGLFRLLGDPSRIANQMESLGRVICDQGDYTRAAIVLAEALAIARAAGNWHSAAFALNDLAVVAHAVGDDDRAIALQDEGLELWQVLGNRDGIASCFENYAVVAMAQSQPERATRLFGAAEAIRLEIGAPGRLIDRQTHARLGRHARAQLGDPAFAHARQDGLTMSLEEAIDFAVERGPPARSVENGGRDPQRDASPSQGSTRSTPG